jgi:hypothetical protein
MNALMHLPQAARSVAAALLVALLLPALAAAEIQLMADTDFEGGALGAMTTANSDWEVQRTGQNTTNFLIDRTAAAAYAGSRGCLMSLPLSASGASFDHTTIGQRFTLEAGVIYEASLRVRWANPAAGSSAIVSFWAQHQADKTFAGKDEWLRNGDWKLLSFRFYAVKPNQPVFVYVSLLPNQVPRKTDIYIDDFKLVEIERVTATAPATNLVADGSFEAQTVGAAPGGAWTLERSAGLGATVINESGGKAVRLSIPADTNNFTEVRLSQFVTLTKGVLYDGNVRMRWDNAAADDDGSGLVNWMLYHQPSNTWYGPIDHVLRNGAWHDVPFVHGAPYSGSYRLFVQVFGWGNFGDAMVLTFDDFSLTPQAATGGVRTITMNAPRPGWTFDLMTLAGTPIGVPGLTFTGLARTAGHRLAPVAPAPTGVQ